MIVEQDELQSMRDEISNLKLKIESLEQRDIPTIKSNPGGTVAALSALLLDPAYPRVSFGPNSPALQYPAQFKFEMTSAFGSQDTLGFFVKSQFTANQNWEQVASWGVSGGFGFTKTMFASNYIKWNPSGTGEAEIGIDLASFGTQLAGMIITGKSQTPGSTAPIIVLDGYVNVAGSGMMFFALDGNIASGNSYLEIVAPSGGVTYPIIRSKTGKINISDLILGNITASQTIQAADLKSTGNAEISGSLFAAGLNITNASAMVFGNNFQKYTPVVSGANSMTATLDAGTDNVNYLRLGPICFIYGNLGVTTGGTPNNYLNVSLPSAVPSVQSTSFIYTYMPTRGSYGEIPSLAGVQNSTQQMVFFAGGTDNANWANGDHGIFFITWYPC